MKSIWQEEIFQDIIGNLKNELDSLTKILKETRERGDFGTYKNIIQAYEKTLGLYIYFFDDKEPPVFNISSEIKLDAVGNIAENIVNEMKKIIINPKSGIKFEDLNKNFKQYNTQDITPIKKNLNDNICVMYGITPNNYKIE